MGRLFRVALALTLTLALGTLPALVGCGGGERVGDIQDTPEAKKADFDGQKAMMEYMRSKSQSKKKR